MKIKFKKTDPRNGTEAEVDDFRAKQLIEAGAADEVVEGKTVDAAPENKAIKAAPKNKAK